MDLITVHVFDSRPEGERVQAILTSSGILSYLLDDDCGGFRPYLGFTKGGFKLQIHRDDCDRASELLQGML